MPKGFPGSVAEHGTFARYNHGGCRCVPCRTARREYVRDIYDLRPRDVYLAEVEPPHGTESRYVSRRFRCRCDECRAAASSARRTRRAAGIEATRAYDRAYKRRRRQEAA